MRYSARVFTILFFCAFTGLGGCSGTEPEFAEVEGVVTLKGKPLSEVEVIFSPITEKGTKGPPASCVTDAEGRYRLRCDRANKSGALVGMHRVVFRDIGAAPPVPGIEITDEKGQPYKPKPLRVPANYTDLQKTPFHDVEVHSGTQTLNFDLK